jgi:hypothetical protein
MLERGKADGWGPGSRRRSRRRRSRRRRRPLWLRLTLWIGGALLFGAAVVVVDAYWQAYRVATPLSQVAAGLNRTRTALSRGKLPVGDPLSGVVEVADRAQVQIEDMRWTFDLVGAIPFLDRPVDVTRHQVVAANEWAAAAVVVQDMLVSLLGPHAQQVEDLQQLEVEDVPPPVLNDGVVDVELVEGLAPAMQELIGHLEAADRAIRAMPSIPLVTKIDRLKEQALSESTLSLEAARNATTGIELLPRFLGADRPRTYYVALQNTADQRATGGAVLAYALLEVDRGVFTLRESGDINDIDDEDRGFPGLDLPPAVSWYIRVAGVNPRLANGANYSGDFPVVASAWAAMVEEARGTPIDGVIAMDPAAIGYALGNNTEIRVPSYPNRITGNNAVFVIANDQYRLDKGLQDAFTSELIEVAWPKLRQPSPFVRKVQQMGTGLREKHIQIWSKDPELQDLLVRLDWDGGLEFSGGDYLFLAHNKRNGNKVDFYLQQEITYDVTVLPTGDIESTYTVKLTGEVPANEPPEIAGREGYGLNVAMENLYVPGTARFLGVEPEGRVEYDTRPAGFVLHPEKEFLVLTKPVEVRPGDPQTIVFRYSIPGVIETTDEGNVYRLTIQHQSMVNPAAVTVHVTLPEGVTALSSEGWLVDGNEATFTTLLTRDLTTELAF